MHGLQAAGANSETTPRQRSPPPSPPPGARPEAGPSCRSRRRAELLPPGWRNLRGARRVAVTAVPTLSSPAPVGSTQPSPGMLPAGTPVANPTLSPAGSPDLLQGLGLPHAPFARLQEERLHRANSSPRALPGAQVTASLLAHLVSQAPTATTRCQGAPDPRCRLPVQGSRSTRTSPHAALQADRCCSMPSPCRAPRDTGFLACSMQIGPKIALLFPSAHSNL